MKETGGKSRYLILGMLAHTPLTGYNIRKWIETEYSHFWQASFGQIYPILKELVREGLVENAPEAADQNGRGQKAYQITEKGLAALSTWLQEEPEIEKLRYEILLKISFGEHTDPQVLLGHLDAFIARNEAALQGINSYMQMMADRPLQPETDHNYSRLTALCGRYHYTAMRDWAMEARNTIAKEVESQ